MKARIFGTLAIICVVFSGLSVGLCPKLGVIMIIPAFFSLFIALAMFCACIESMPDYDKIASKLSNLFNDEED